MSNNNANLGASASSASSATTITPKGSPSNPQPGRFASLSPSKPGGLVRRPSLGRQATVIPGSSKAEKRRSVVNGTGGVAEDVKSPGELTVFVDKLLSDLEGKFDLMSHDLLERMNQMSDRIDQIENSIHEIISTDLDQHHHQHRRSSDDRPDADDNSSPRQASSPRLDPLERDIANRTTSTGDSSGDFSRMSKGQDEAHEEQSLLLAEPPIGVGRRSSGSS